MSELLFRPPIFSPLSHVVRKSVGNINRVINITNTIIFKANYLIYVYLIIFNIYSTTGYMLISFFEKASHPLLFTVLYIKPLAPYDKFEALYPNKSK